MLFGIILGVGLAWAQDRPAPGPLRLGSHFDQNLVKRVPPVYPLQAKQARVQGTVRCEVLVGKDGNVKSVKLLSGHPLLAKPAMDALKRWQFKPWLLNDKPVEVIGQTQIEFELSREPESKAIN